jgi:thiamine phosphate phosphatase / amino-HMP aminohydrolase
MDSDGKGTGFISKGDESGICTGYDKLREMKKVIAEHSSSHLFTTVYVGDSDTDLPCLLHADIGIVMGDGATVIETCNRVGIQLRSHPSFREIHPKRERQGNILYRFDSWHGIAQSGLLE